MRIIENQPINTAAWFLDSQTSLIQTSLSGVSEQRRRLKFRLPQAMIYRVSDAKTRPRLNTAQVKKIKLFEKVVVQDSKSPS